MTVFRNRIVRAVALVACAATPLAACSSTGTDVTAASSATTSVAASPTTTSPSTVAATSSAPVAPIPPATGPHNEIDVMFPTDMIPHHRQAVEMAALAATKANDPRVKDLARRIGTAQDSEVTLMAGWLTTWGEPVPAPDQMHTAHGPGMMTHAEMEDLKDTKGLAFDRMFCDMMIRHHEGALQMAEVTSTRGQNPAVVALAKQVFAVQTAEVAELHSILEDL